MMKKTTFYATPFLQKGVFLLALALSLGFLACASGASGRGDVYGGLGQGSDPVPFMAKARRGTLPNGLRYYILQNSLPENRAFLTLAVNAGSVLETDEEQGLAHFVEHMAFNGTARFPEMELLNYLRSLGMRFGPDVNAHTSFDETVFGIEVPIEQGANGVKRIPDNALAVIDDWTYAITFDPRDVDDERLVIMEEYRTRLGAGERVQRVMLPILFRGSPYAERLPIGKPEVIQNAPASRLANFYKTWYRTDNMAVILVGDFDPAALEAELVSHFSASAPSAPFNRPAFELPNPRKGDLRIETITDPEYPYVRFDLYYKRAPQAIRGDLASYRQGVIDYLISQMLSARIDEAGAKPETPYAGAGGWEDRYGQASRFYVLAVIAKPGNARESLQAILREKESISRYGFTAGEIDRAKRTLVSSMMRMVSEKDRQESNSFVDDFTSHFLRNQNVADIDWELDAVTKLLPGISAQDITDAVKAYFAGDDLTVFLIAPEAERSNLPVEAEIRRIIEASKREQIPRPLETALTDELLDQMPVGGAIVAEVQDLESGAIRWTLSNGAQVILKETANKNNEIVLYATARGGSTQVPEAEEVSAGLAAEMLNASGAGPYTRTELVQKLAGKQVALSFWTGAFNRGFAGSSTTGDLQTLFELLYLNFTQPRIGADEVQAILDQYRTDLIQRGENPEAVFWDEVTKTVYGNNPYFAPLELGALERVNRDQAMNFIRQSLNPADYTFIFTGNLDLPAIRGFTETYLAAIPAGEARFNTWRNPHIVRPQQVEREVFRGREEKSIVYLAWFQPEPYGEAGSAAASVLNGYLDIILIEEIREKLGGVYSVQAAAALSPLPPEGELVLESLFVCDPHRAVELSDAVERQLNLIAQGTINADTFGKAVEALQKSWEDAMQSNSYIASNYGSLAVILDLPLGRLHQWPVRYGAVTPADIQALCRRVLANGHTRLILYPEGWTN
jgi:zinc protease